jgi:hypothetical protein
VIAIYEAGTLKYGVTNPNGDMLTICEMFVNGDLYTDMLSCSVKVMNDYSEKIIWDSKQRVIIFAAHFGSLHSIPSEIGHLTALQQLYLNNNQLSGSILSEIGHVTALQQLYLSNIQLSGSIPSEIGHLTALQQLYLNNNQLSESIP